MSDLTERFARANPDVLRVLELEAEVERLTAVIEDLEQALKCAYVDEGYSYDEAVRAVAALKDEVVDHER